MRHTRNSRESRLLRPHLGMLMALAMIALFSWGCSDNPTVNNDEATTDIGSGNTTPFAAQVDEVMAVASEHGDQSEEFKAAMETLIDRAEASEAEHETSKGVETKALREISSKGHGYGRTIDGPTVIDRPGFYFVTQDFSAMDDGIVIQSDWVFLILGNHTITGPGAKEGRGVVVDGVHRAIVMGGVLENFGMGVVLNDAKSSMVRWVTINGADEFADPAGGIPPQIGIMLVNSPRNHIRANSLTDINLGIFVRGGHSRFNRLLGNEVMGGDHGLLAICYNPAPTGGDAGPRHDAAYFNLLSHFGAGIQTSAGSERNRFQLNSIYYFNEAYRDFNGSNIFRNNYTEQLVPDGMAALELSFDGLTDLGPDFVYEGWVIVDGSPVTTGTFTVDGSGMPSQTQFWVDADDLAHASKFVLTIEPAVDPDPAPASTHYLSGDFLGNNAELTTADPAALGSDFMSASGSFILNTPSTGSDDTDYDAGIWWLDPMAGPGATLDLPTLPAGWVYEGWVVGPGGPVTTGRFTDPAMADEDGAGSTSGPDGFPPFPGQDYIDPLMSLIGYAAVITVEPMPDNSADPFALKPLVDGNIEDVGIGVLQSMMNNAGTFPTGSASR
ncbi:hypothetical protein GF377_05160 [candidate division GN15 bacterium]|nr:hypothetical protein [candidate division GN15 bacterium]